MEEINIRKIFGGNIKKYRKKRGLSQEQFGTPRHNAEPFERDRDRHEIRYLQIA